MFIICLVSLLAQATAVQPEPAPQAAPVAVVAAPALVAKSGTPLRLMVWNEVSTRSAKPGDRFLLVLDSPVTVDGQLVIPRGTKAWGEVVAARSSGMVGRAGKLETRLLHLETSGGEVPITPATVTSLADKGAGATLQILAVTAALTPWGPFTRGNNARLKAGHIVQALLGADVAAAPLAP